MNSSNNRIRRYTFDLSTSSWKVRSAHQRFRERQIGRWCPNSLCLKWEDLSINPPLSFLSHCSAVTDRNCFRQLYPVLLFLSSLSFNAWFWTSSRSLQIFAMLKSSQVHFVKSLSTSFNAVHPLKGGCSEIQQVESKSDKVNDKTTTRLTCKTWLDSRLSPWSNDPPVPLHLSSRVSQLRSKCTFLSSAWISGS